MGRINEQNLAAGIVDAYERGADSNLNELLSRAHQIENLTRELAHARQERDAAQLECDKLDAVTNDRDRLNLVAQALDTQLVGVRELLAAANERAEAAKIANGRAHDVNTELTWEIACVRRDLVAAQQQRDEYGDELEKAKLRLLAIDNAKLHQLAESAVRIDTLCVIDEVIDERKRQDARWGGPAHDDQHVISDWKRYLTARVKALDLCDGPLRRQRLLETAALAVAAIESFDRRANTKDECVCVCVPKD